MKISDYEKAETSNIDFKEKVEYTKPKSWLKSVSAFANTKGGVLLFGIRDSDKIPVGVSNLTKDTEKITELINSKITPIPRYNLSTFQDLEKDFIEVRVGDGPMTPYYYDSDGRKEAYIRSGNASVIAPKHVLDELILKGKNTTFDELPTSYVKDDVSFTFLNAMLKKTTDKEFDINKDLVSLELITPDGKITNAGLLFSDQNLLIQSRVFCTRWKGNVKGSVDGDAIDDKEFGGSIIAQLNNVEAFVKNNSKISWEIEGMNRIVKEEYPLRAVREAVVNAIIHRDYQIIGSEVHVDMYDNRMEITSPGGMIDGSFIQNMDIKKISSMRRNRVISDLFNRLNLMERRGSGLTRIMESYKECEIKPMFSSDFSSFKVVLPNKNFVLKKSPVVEQKSPAATGNFVSDEDYFMLRMHKLLPDKVTKNTYNQIEKVFATFGYNKEFNRDDIERILQVKRSRASEIIAMLYNSGLIVPASPTKYKFEK